MSRTANRLTEAYEEITSHLTNEATPALLDKIAPSMRKLELVVNELNGHPDITETLDDLNRDCLQKPTNTA